MKCLGVDPEQLKPFDQVKDEVAKDWRTRRAADQVAKYRARPGHQPERPARRSKSVAKDLNVEILTSDALKRDGITVNVLPAAVAQAFTLPEKGFGSAASGVDEGRIVFQVDKVTAAKAARCRRGERLEEQLGLSHQRRRHRGIFQRAGKPLRRERSTGRLSPS